MRSSTETSPNGVASYLGRQPKGYKRKKPLFDVKTYDPANDTAEESFFQQVYRLAREANTKGPRDHLTEQLAAYIDQEDGNQIYTERTITHHPDRRITIDTRSIADLEFSHPEDAKQSFLSIADPEQVAGYFLIMSFQPGTEDNPGRSQFNLHLVLKNLAPSAIKGLHEFLLKHAYLAKNLTALKKVINEEYGEGVRVVEKAARRRPS